uniref:Zinc finger protein 692 n=1 Tax=Anas platyrhynchos platyrhynchos TaxID=8840 RepID=A0A493TIQ1_ANAPP
MDPGRPGRQRAPDCVRRQKRRELDARRSKCRIRLGGHLEQWCRLKEQLGFALHSQLAKFLLDRSVAQKNPQNTPKKNPMGSCAGGRCGGQGSLPSPRWTD